MDEKVSNCKYSRGGCAKKCQFMFKDNVSIITAVINGDAGRMIYVLFWCHFATLVIFTGVNYALDSSKMYDDTAFMRHQFASVHYALAISIGMHILIFTLVYPIVQASCFHVVSLLFATLIILAGLLVAPLYLAFTLPLSQLAIFIALAHQLTLLGKVISFLAEKKRIRNNTLHKISLTKQATSAFFVKTNKCNVSPTSGAAAPEIKIESQSSGVGETAATDVYSQSSSDCTRKPHEICSSKDGQVEHFIRSSSPLLPLARDGKSDSFYISEGSFESLSYDINDRINVQSNDDIVDMNNNDTTHGDSGDRFKRTTSSTSDGGEKKSKLQFTVTNGKRKIEICPERKATGIFESLASHPGAHGNSIRVTVDAQLDENGATVVLDDDVSDTNLTPEHEDEETSRNGFYHFVYFIFSPTLVYSEFYPRRHAFQWKRFLGHTVEFVVIVAACSHLIVKYHLSWARSIGITTYTVEEYMWHYYKVYYLMIIMYAASAYAFFHCALNAWGELLLFADRRFYRNWWTPDQHALQSIAASFHIVNLWTERYISRPVLAASKSQWISSIATTLASLVAVESILFISFKLFLPFISCTVIILKVFNHFISPLTTVKCFIINTFTLSLLTLGAYIYTLEYYSRINCSPVEHENEYIFTVQLMRCIKIRLPNGSLHTSIW